MNRILKVTRLHLNKRELAFGRLLLIIGIVWLISVIIILAIQRAGVDPANPAYIDGARQNMGVVWSLPGFLVYFGVQAIATTFPFALALGTTRRAYVLGTAVSSLVQAAYITVVLSILLMIELATDHWFMGLYVLDTYLLGSGNIGFLAVAVFVGVFALLSIGGIFGAFWVRYGSKGPALFGLALALGLALLILALVPQAEAIFAGITGPRLAIAGLLIALVSLVGTWLCMRRTSVR